MKVLFLDIDGVLNGVEYQMSPEFENSYIDKSRLPILKAIADRTGAKIVLSSTRKKDWVPGNPLDSVFTDAGISLYDKTPAMGRKNLEIAAWLSAHPEVDSFVILDDADGGWGELYPRLVPTFPVESRGLTEEHIAKVSEKFKI